MEGRNWKKDSVVREERKGGYKEKVKEDVMRDVGWKVF